MAARVSSGPDATPLEAPGPASPSAEAFGALFGRWSRVVRGRLAARRVLVGLGVGLALGAAGAGLAWHLDAARVRLAAPVLAVGGAAAGGWVARKRRWPDREVALFLDARLDAGERVTSALELHRAWGSTVGSAGAASRFMLSDAAAALRDAPQSIAPRVLVRPQLLGAVALPLLVVAMLAPMPVHPLAKGHAPGAPFASVTAADKLDAAARLGALAARDDEQRARLEKLARDASDLREAMRRGLEPREAQARLGALEEALAAERLSLGNGEHRDGLERAVGRLEQTGATRRAAQALGDHDLQTFDAEMEKLANRREREDRASAKEALEEASRAAREAKAPDVAKALDEARSLAEERERRADLVRELSDAMAAAGDPSARTESEALDRKQSDEAARALGKALGEALEKMTPEQRARLATKMREQASRAHGKGAAEGRKALEEMARGLSTEEGKKALQEQLENLAKEPTKSGEAEREQALDEAEDGARGAEGEMSGTAGAPVPMPGNGAGKQGSNPGGDGAPGGDEKGGAAHDGSGPTKGSGGGPGDGKPGGGGSGHDGKGGAHGAGGTPEVAADTLKSRATGALSPGGAALSAITTYEPGHAGATANQRGTGDLRAVAPSEVEAVDRSDVPEEYREQVRKYFQP